MINSTRFMSYDYRMGCVAVYRDGTWYCVEPTGKAKVCHSERTAELLAQHKNLTATAEERDEWRYGRSWHTGSC